MVNIDKIKLKMRHSHPSPYRGKTLARGLVLFLLLMGLTGMANAATYYDKTFTESTTVTFSQVSGTTKFKVAGDNTEYDAIGTIVLNTAGITVNFKFNSGTFMMHDRIIIRRGRLNITLNNETRNVTLKRQNGNTNYLFLVDNRTTTSYNDTRLVIKGADGHRIKLDGNATWSMSGSNSAGWEATFTSGVKADYAMIYMRAGRADISFVDFQNNWCADVEGTGGFFRITTVVTGENPSQCINYVLIDDCSFTKGYAEKHGSVMYAGGRLVNDTKSYVRIRRCLVQNCFCNANDIDPVSGNNSGGGIFRTGGNGATDLEITNSVMKNNKCKRTGTITWNSGIGTLTLTNDTIMNNWSGANGGGLSVHSSATISKCKILNNYAANNGGGIYYRTYSNSDDALPNYTPNNGSLELDAQTEINGNYADNNGGGIYFTVSPINVTATAHGALYTVFKNKQGSQYEVNLSVNGAKVMNNTAGNHGGGIFINRTTDIYKSDLKVNYGTIENNNVTNNGGGFYVTSSLSGTVYGTCPYALTNLNVTLGSTSGTLQVVNNSAINGGGCYITGTKHVTTINNGTIGAQAKPNRATGGNGGGLCIIGGLVNVNGGNIQYNTATGNGGGFYVSISNDTDIATIKGGATIINNSATNGGGAYVNKGQLRIQDATTKISTNTATTSGGGIYMANGTVTYTNAQMLSNTATNSDGGGLYLGNGTMTVSGSSAAIRGNSAPIPEQRHGSTAHVP